MQTVPYTKNTRQGLEVVWDFLIQRDKKMLKTHSRRMVGLLVVFIAIVGFAFPALGDTERPMSGHADETIIDIQPGDDDEIHVTATGEGHATHLGHFTRLGHVVIDSAGHVEGTVVFTAANGDELHAHVAGDPTGAPEKIAGTYTFTGGTGRFSDASGGMSFTGVISDDIYITVVFKGVIQY